MTMREFNFTLSLMALVLLLAAAAYVRSFVAPRGRHAPAPGRLPNLVIDPVHVGVTETSPPLVAVMKAAGVDFGPQPPTLHVVEHVQHTPAHALDEEAQAILDRWDGHVRDWLTAPGYVRDFQQRVDAAHQAAGMYDEAHRRWRAGAWDVPTGEFRAIVA